MASRKLCEDGEVFPLDILYYPIFKKLNLYLRNRIIWHFGHGLHASRRFSGRYGDHLMVHEKQENTCSIWMLFECHRNTRQATLQRPNVGKPSGNPFGQEPSDIWQIVLRDWEEALWDVPNLKSNHPEKTAHPCQFPIELVERCVLALTNEGDWVLDPYAACSSLLASIMHNRRAAGSGKEDEYVQIARERLTDYFNGNLRVRPLGKPVFQPTGKEKASRVPEEWQTAPKPQGRLLEKKEQYK